eukprot:scaffold286493_cov18-Prasinocladus_malaysianus.AAC.1
MSIVSELTLVHHAYDMSVATVNRFETLEALRHVQPSSSRLVGSKLGSASDLTSSRLGRVVRRTQTRPLMCQIRYGLITLDFIGPNLPTCRGTYILTTVELSSRTGPSA